MDKKRNIGSCSWKYDSWQGLIYPESKGFNYLQEYSRHYTTVEVDQWFWSLFPGDKVVLPKLSVVEEYARSVPQDFRFGIKVPNSITLTHYYKKTKTDTLVPNPHFLSAELMERFLAQLAPLNDKIGPLIFQFEYLNKLKMPGGLSHFIDLFEKFAEQLSDGQHYSIECRNPNYLNSRYFDFLNRLSFSHTFLQGYYMPSIFELYKQYKKQISDRVVIRLHGPDRQGIEKQTGNDWSQIVAPKDKEVTLLAEMLVEMESRGMRPFVFVNNHYEGSAPRTIERITKQLKT